MIKLILIMEKWIKEISGEITKENTYFCNKQVSNEFQKQKIKFLIIICNVL